MDVKEWNARAIALRRKVRDQDSVGRRADVAAFIISALFAAAVIAFPFYAAMTGMSLGTRGGGHYSWQSGRIMFLVMVVPVTIGGVLGSRIVFAVFGYLFRKWAWARTR